MRAEFSLRAKQDLLDLYAYGAETFGVASAESYAAAITRTVHLITSQPKMARLRKEFSPPVRVHHWRSHYIVYVENPTGIVVIRVLHHTSDLLRHLAEEGE